MLETLMLIFFGFTGFCSSVYQMKETNYRYAGLKNTLLLLLSVAGFFPLVEEALYRHTLKYYLSDFEYAYYINSVLFGLSHTINYAITRSVKLTAMQVVATTYLGYYCVQFDNFLYALLTHVSYNFLITSSALAFHVYFKRYTECDFESSDAFIPRIYYNKSTRDDINVGRFQRKIRRTSLSIPRNKVNKEMLDRIEKFEAIENKRSPFCLKF